MRMTFSSGRVLSMIGSSLMRAPPGSGADNRCVQPVFATRRTGVRADGHCQDIAVDSGRKTLLATTVRCKPENMSSGIAIRTLDLTKRFGTLLALDSVELNIVEGEIFGYLGPNGAGKSTTLRLLVGLLRPTAGSARVFGLDPWSSAPAVHRLIGYVPGELALYDRLTSRQHITFFGHLRGRPDDKAATVIADRLDLDLDRPVRTMSKGNRQKLALVLALMSSPQLLILDEPTGGLDPLVQHEFHAMMREHTAAGGTVLLSSHILSEVQQVADRVGVLREGRLIAVESLHELRQKSLHHVTAEFAARFRNRTFASWPASVTSPSTAPR